LIGIFIGEIAVYFAYRLGLCESMGVAGLLPFLSPRREPVTVAANGKPGVLTAYVWCYAIIAAALILSIDAFNSGLELRSLALTMAVPILAILTVRFRTWRTYPWVSMSFFVVSSGFILMFLSFIYQSYRLSLLIFTLVLTVLICLTWCKKLSRQGTCPDPDIT
jgi:hypothetical protein